MTDAARCSRQDQRLAFGVGSIGHGILPLAGAAERGSCAFYHDLPWPPKANQRTLPAIAPWRTRGAADAGSMLSLMLGGRAMPSNLRVDPERLWGMLMDTAAFGATPKGGINRQTLTAEDGAVRAWLQRECEGLGCKVTVDEVGNMFALRPGRLPELPPIALGSHLDTQPTGGKFDGNLGVLGALEVMRTLVAAGYETNAPLVVVNWTNEEGARFSPAMLGSGVFAGVYARAAADAVIDPEGVRFGDALDALGWRGEAKAGAMQLSAYLELHIEQGPILEAERKRIGI